MADTTTTAPHDRGHLTIKDRAVERISLAATLGTPGVGRHGSGLGRLAGRDLPRIHVDVAGDHVRADVDVAVEWGRPLADTALAVRRGVTHALAEQSGFVVDGVTVHVAAVIPPADSESRRVE